MKVSFYIFILLLIGLKVTAQPNLEIESFLPGVSVTDICSDGSDIWITTDGRGIYKYSSEKESWKNYSTQKNNLKHDFFYCIASSDKYVWAGSSDGLFIFDKRRKRWSKRKFGKGGQLGNWIRSLEYDKYDRILWIGRFKNLTRFDLKKRRFTDFDLTVNGNEKTNTIKTIKVDGDSLVWFGTEAGVHKFYKSIDLSDPKSRYFYNNSRNYFNRDGKSISISTILIEQNNVWFGLDEFITKNNPDYNVGGVYKFNRQNEWIRFDKTDGFEANGIYDMEVTGKYIWVSLYQFNIEKKEPFGQGIVLIDRISGEVKTLNGSEIPSEVYSLLYDGTSIWLGSKNGITKINLSTRFIPSFTNN